MTANSFIARAPQVAARMLGDELMIVSSRDSALFTLNETAAAIWNGADGATPLASIVDRHICAAFDVDRAEALRDAEGLVSELAEHGVLIVSPSPIRDAI